ncbi:hypothetical protein ACH3XW_49590 [Acanthocheilonema viteae]
MANVMLAAYNAIEATVRMLCPDLYKNMEITDMIDKIASIYQRFKRTHNSNGQIITESFQSDGSITRRARETQN